MSRTGVTAGLVCLAVLPAWATTPVSHAGLDGRAISMVSAQDVDEFPAGLGWGFAKSAGLNGSPGPTHLQIRPLLTRQPIKTNNRLRRHGTGGDHVAN